MSIFGQSAFLSTFWARIQYSETTKIMISGKKYFAHDFFICIPLIYVKERKFHDHHYQKVARSSDSYRQWLLRYVSQIDNDLKRLQDEKNKCKMQK